MSFFDTISRIIQQGKEIAVKATPSSTLTYNKVTPVDNSQFTSNPLLRDKPLTYQPPVVQQPTFNVPIKAEIPQASTRVAETTPQQTNLTMAQQVSNIIQGGKEAAVLGGGLAKDVARGTTRGAMAGGTFVGARLLGADVNTASQAQFKPKTGLEKFLFGEQPVSVQSEGIAPLESMGVSPDTAKKYGAPFVLGSIALDAFTGGSSKGARRTLEKVAANMTAEDATLLRNLYTKPDVKNVMPRARNEQAIINALKLDKLPYSEQKKAVSNILKEYDKRWGGVDEALNPPVPPNKPGAMDIKKPNVLEKTVLKKSEPLEGEAKKYKSAEDFVNNFDASSGVLDRMAFGHATGDVFDVKVSELRPKYKEDLANAQDAVKKGGGRSNEPIQVSIELVDDKPTFFIEDGYHRYVQAQRDGKTNINVIVDDIKDNPLKVLSPNNLDYTKYLKKVWEEANAKPTPLNKKPNVLEKTVLKKSEPLEVEAKKYKSAEDFVKAQGRTVYHGTNKENAKMLRENPRLLTPDEQNQFPTTVVGDTQIGVSTSQQKDIADYFASLQPTGKGEVVEFVLPNNAKIYRLPEGNEIDNLGLAELQRLKREGFDAVEDVSNAGGEAEIRVLSPEKLKTRAQLTDIYNKANAKPASVNKKPNKMADFRAGKPNSEGGYIRNPLAKTPEKSPKVNELKKGDLIIENNGNSMEFVQKIQTTKGDMYAFKTKGQPEGSFELFNESQIDELLKNQNTLRDDVLKLKAKKDTEALEDEVAKQNLQKQKDALKIKELEVNKFLTTLDTGDRLNANKTLKRLVSSNGKLIKEYEAIDEFIAKGNIKIKELRQTRGAKKGQLVKVLVSEDNKIYPLDSKGSTSYAEFQLKNSVLPTKVRETSPLEIVTKLPANNQVVSSGNDSTRLSLIDRLIADNKVRVVSRDGRDVYQVKKGGEWVNKRDEDSAIRAVTPRSPIDVIKKTKAPKFASDATEQRVLAAEIAKEALDADPAKQLTKYIAKRGEFKGSLPEVTGKQANKTGVNLDVHAPDLGYADSEEARQAYEAYKIKKVEVENELKSAKEARRIELQTKPIAPVQPKVRQMSRSRDVAWLEREATDRALREQKRIERQTSPAFRSVLDEPTRLSPERVKQLEKSAMPTAEVTRPSTPYKAESLQDIVTKTPLDRKVNIIDYLRTPDRVLNKIGFGKEAKLLRDQYEKYSIELPKNIDKISAWVKRAPEKGASERIFQYLDGKTVKLSANEQKVADEIKAYLKEWADRLGLPEENRVANYITRLFDDQLIKQEFDEDLAKIISGKIPGEVYNPFLQKRLGAKGYKQDVWGALDAYTKRATRKVHIDPALERIREKAGSSLDFTNLEESQFKYIQRYIDRVQMRPTEIDNAIDNAVKQTLGYRFGQRPVTTISRFLRRMTYRGMLGGNLSSAIRNLSQGVNTYAVLGEKYTAIGYAKLLQPASQRELIEQGIFNNNFIEDRVLSSTKKLLQKGDKALWFFFDKAEKINRGSAYLGAKAKGLGRGMTEEQAIDYAKNIVRKTQFSYDAVDQPVALGSDIMKTLFQFQTYTTKQTEFLSEIVKGAVKGDKKMQNVVSLLRYGIAGYVFVNTVGKALGMTEAELIPLYQNLTGERKTSLAPSLKFPIEVGKAIAGTPDKYGNERDFSEKASDVGKSLIGLIPGGNQIKKTYEGYKAVQEGGSFTKSGNLQFEQGTSKASQIQSILFGKYASQNAKDYFNKKTTTGNKELDKAKKEDQKNTEARSSRADILVASLNDKTKEEKVAYLKELYTTDKDMYDRVLKKIEQKKLNWSKEEKAIADLGVKSGAKAAYVKSQLAKMETKEEKVAYLKDLYERKIISKEVLDQITGAE